MSSPFESKFFDPALRPVFDEHVAIEATRPDGVIRGTFRASVFVGDDEEPLEGAFDSTVRSAVILVAKYGEDAWPRRDDPPRAGDTVTLASGVTFAVVSRDPLVSAHYQLTARQVDE